MIRTTTICFLLLVFNLAQSQRPLRPNDVYRIKSISTPMVSPEGNWIVYGVSSVDSVKDKGETDLWMTSWDGKDHVRLTYSPEGENQPKFSPDGKYLSFLATKNNSNHAQVMLMDRRGGEAKVATKIAGEIQEYHWSPDGKKLVLSIKDLERNDSLKNKPRNPLVLNQYKVKQDVEGYVLPLRRHLYVFDLEKEKLDTLTSGAFDEFSPEWSPDGKQIVFVSNRTAEPDRNDNTDLWLVDAKPGSAVRRLTDWAGSDEKPTWSPDGKFIAYVRSTGSGNFLMYEQTVLCTISPSGGEPVEHTRLMDRDADVPQWSVDGKKIGFLVTDDRKNYLSELIDLKKIEAIAPGEYRIEDLQTHPSGAWLVTASFPNRPEEIYALEAGNFRQLTSLQDGLLKSVRLSIPRGFTSKSKDGAMVSGILYPPPGRENEKNLPTIFYIHGGPVAQDDFGFDLTRQILAASGYAVAAVNYRGSNGRGLAYTQAIWADWGNKEVLDILGASDHLVREGISDPKRLAIGGWSYGGILTNYCIATDPMRFRSAVSGAGSSLQLSLFGVDQYIVQYENELGYPWKNLNKYLKLSYPFLKADQIKTPTMFMTGEKDFNVPAVGSEQMYQALKVLGTPTQLIVYPGQFHGITVPSYQADRYRRYIEWFGKYLDQVGSVQLNKSR